VSHVYVGESKVGIIFITYNKVLDTLEDLPP
jgi:hypothetical protein